MIGLDTNVLVRYLVQDDPRQSEAANGLIDSLTADEQGFVSVVALVETTWVLQRVFGRSAEQVREIVRGLLESVEIVVDSADLVRSALAMDAPQFSDALVAASGTAAGVTSTATFDRRAAALPGMQLLS